jgi:hypothetical protein
MIVGDRELLEWAAKAAGINGVWFAGYLPTHPGHFGTSISPAGHDVWDPINDDGDALRLAVKLNIPVFPYDEETSTGTIGVVAENWGSKEANTRRAITRAAAEIGKATAPCAGEGG